MTITPCTAGYPEFLTRTHPDDRKNWLRSYRQTYLDVDLRELVNLRHPESFERFEPLFAARIGSLLNISELARDCGLAADTIRRFLNYYRQLFVAWSQQPFYANIGKRVMKMPRWYFTDTGLLRSLLGRFDLADGVLFENAVLTDLRKRVYTLTMDENAYFLRTATGVEVDSVFDNKEGNATFFCEVKLSATPHRSDIRHLRKVVIPTTDGIGLLLNRSAAVEKLDDRIWSVPVWWLLS